MKKRQNNFFEFKQKADNGLELYIYDDVQGDYFDWAEWETVESETSANYFRDKLAEYPNVSQIDIYINSLGGSCYEGNAIYAQLKRHTAKKVVHIDGYACSIASVIAMAGDEVRMSPNAVMMIHNAWVTASGNAEELRRIAEQLDTVSAASRQAYLAKSGGKLEEKQLIAMMNEEKYLTAAECIELGLADSYETDGRAGGILQKAAAARAAMMSAAGMPNKAMLRKMIENIMGEMQQQAAPAPDNVPEKDTPAEQVEEQADEKKQKTDDFYAAVGKIFLN